MLSARTCRIIPRRSRARHTRYAGGHRVRAPGLRMRPNGVRVMPDLASSFAVRQHIYSESSEDEPCRQRRTLRPAPLAAPIEGTIPAIQSPMDAMEVGGKVMVTRRQASP